MSFCVSKSETTEVKNKKITIKNNKVQGFYDLDITQTTVDSSFVDRCEIMIVDQNNNAPFVTFSTEKICANLVPGKSMIPIVVNDKDDCSLGNCYPFTFELYEGTELSGS